MIDNKKSVWFWQNMITPHMSSLAKALADRGFNVVYIANEILSTERKKQGWEVQNLGNVKLKFAKNKYTAIQYAEKAPKNSIHLCQGLRGNGLISNAQKIIRKRGLKHWVMLESIDDKGCLGLIKIIFYKLIIFYWRDQISGVLAIGKNSVKWFINQGFYEKKIYPFAYFLQAPKKIKQIKSKTNIKNKRPFRFIYIGSLINLKRVDLLIKSIGKLKKKELELWVVGTGPEERHLKNLAKLTLPEKVHWYGVKPMSEILYLISQVDCLVLPSRYDGWGAVVSEALMVGTPAICSNNCGSSIIVEASGVGSIFLSNDQKDLTKKLNLQLKKGKINLKDRKKTQKWAKCLTSISGAKYLEKILELKNKNANKIIKAPWNKK